MRSAAAATGRGDIMQIGTLALDRARPLHDARIAYELHGPAHAPAVLVLGGISSGRELLPQDGRSGWWPAVAGASRALDPRRFRILSVDYVGGRGASSQPHSAASWPAVTTRDQSRALLGLLDGLGIDALYAVVGASYGGMVALALAEQAPARVDRAVIICAAHRSSAMTTALRSVQRRIIRLGMATGAAEDAVGIARALAITTYRTADEFDDRFGRRAELTPDGVRAPVDDYLDHHAANYATSFDAASYLVLSESLDLHDVDPARITTPTTLLAFDSDTLVPSADVRRLATLLPDCRALRILPSRYGHDAFLKEPVVSDIVAAALAASAATLVPEPMAPQRPTHYAARVAEQDRAPATCSARAGIGADTQHGAVIPPIHLSTTFTFDGLAGKRPYDYTRSGNPTRDLLAGSVAELEQGAAGLVTASGMAAIHVVLQLLRPGDLLIAAHDGYGGTWRLLQALARRHAFEVELADLTHAAAASTVRAKRPRMIWIETPSNPLLRITDIAAITEAAHDVGALCVVDNTFLSPALQTPLVHGADIVVHSTTKYLNGHSDVVGGAIIAADLHVAEELGWWANCTGATGSPFDSWLSLRGLRTLQPRMRTHQENAQAIVDLLSSHAAVSAVHYPGLRAHPGHEIACRQQRGFGAMVSFELRGGEQSVRSLVPVLRHFSLAESLGGVESLIAHPATMTHAAMDPAARAAAGIGDGLLRLSVGIEDVADLVADLRNALDRIDQEPGVTCTRTSSDPYRSRPRAAHPAGTPTP